MLVDAIGDHRFLNDPPNISQGLLIVVDPEVGSEVLRRWHEGKLPSLNL